MGNTEVDYPDILLQEHSRSKDFLQILSPNWFLNSVLD